MYKDINIAVQPNEAVSDERILSAVSSFLKIDIKRIKEVRKIKRSVDARRRNIKVNLRLGVWIDEEAKKEMPSLPVLKDVSSAKEVIIVGAGPAGLFAALDLIEGGMKPVIIERGKAIEDRKEDIKELYRTGIVDGESNFSFGEGGAGTFSDGKLFTRSKKRGNVQRILEILHHYGAQEDILWDGHPHIGTDVLSKVIMNIRKAIIEFGGEVHFNTKVTDFILEENTIKGVVCGEKKFLADNVILATGHSARDMYSLLNDSGITLEAKNFAVGVRIEHPQELIDTIQYHSPTGRGEYLPAAEYSFVGQFNERGVYSFCMCPGGIVVPAATDKNQQVVNGMSSSGRNTPWANSAMVVEVKQDDLHEFSEYGVLAGMHFQEKMENDAYNQGTGLLKAPAQRMQDFVYKRVSRDLPSSSYKMGLNATDMNKCLPAFVSDSLQKAFVAFGKKATGFLTNEALMIGVETRTSSPVKIPRDKESCQHIKISGLYPCGEGSGYAGGIVSAAMDGCRCVAMILPE
jgi:uncharacterized FAD-dependent dehydrogenase